MHSPEQGRIKQRLSLALFCLSAGLISACSDSVTDSGGGSGDTDPDPQDVAQAIALIEPLVGIYDLPDNWSNNPPDEAFLEIRQPDNDGVADALLYDWDDIDSCLPQRPSQGLIRRDPFTGEVFMDELLSFSNAVLSGQSNALVIRFLDTTDLDDDGDTSDFVSLEAPRAGVALISDLGPTC